MSSAFAFTAGGTQGQGNLYLICEREIGRDVVLNNPKTINDLSFSTKHWCRTFMPEQIDYLLKYKKQEMAIYKKESPAAYERTKKNVANESECVSFLKKAAKDERYAKFTDLPSPYKENCKNLQMDFVMMKAFQKLENMPQSQ